PKPTIKIFSTAMFYPIHIQMLTRHIRLNIRLAAVDSNNLSINLKIFRLNQQDSPFLAKKSETSFFHRQLSWQRQELKMLMIGNPFSAK
ncbi:MAG: hypothetical protein RMJ15_07950, partial [Nitrososphaerota archaeon]|nr:hypothetical protein [Nitrososphaerota archaeon]